MKNKHSSNVHERESMCPSECRGCEEFLRRLENEIPDGRQRIRDRWGTTNSPGFCKLRACYREDGVVRAVADLGIHESGSGEVAVISEKDRRGYATNALRNLLPIIKRYGVSQVSARINETNIRSQNLAARLGAEPAIEEDLRDKRGSVRWTKKIG